MNYVRHLNAFFSLVRSDKRLTSTNVSLYFALFYYWNFNRFQNPFTIYRENILELSKLSKNTYHKSIKQLHDAKYIYYHPSASRFRDVRISIIRLDKEEEEKKAFKQLDLFSGAESLPPLEGDLEGGRGAPCRKIETSTVANLVQDCRKIETDTVAKLRHIYKPNNKTVNSVSNTPTEIFKKNEEINQKINALGAQGVPCHPELVEGQGGVRQRRTGDFKPTLQQVEEFFTQKNYSLTEAHKFFHYNQAKNWMLTEELPITDWKALATKWILNLSPAGGGGQRPGVDHGTKSKPQNMHETIQQLYELYLKGEKINKFILPEFADHLKLEITHAVNQEAIQRRINQLSGSNERSTLALWTAYMKEDPNDELFLQDQPNLTALAKRLAVSKHFQKLKSSGQTTIL